SHARPRRLVVAWQQTLVDRDGPDSRLHRLLIPGVDQFLVVQAPGGALGGRRQGVANGVTLPGIGLEFGDAAVDFVHPPVLSRRDYRVTEPAARARNLVDSRTRLDDLGIGEQPP